MTTNFFRDFDNVKATGGYDLNDKFSLSVNYVGLFYSDDKNIRLRVTGSNNVFGELAYKDNFKNAFLRSSIQAGYRFDKQADEFNKGIDAYGELELTNLELNSYLFEGELKAGYEDLNPRRNNIIYTRAYVDKSFSNDKAKNEFEGSFSRTRKDFYFPADLSTTSQFGVNNNIEKRTEYIASAYDRFDYSISEKLLFYMTVLPYYKSVTKENLYIPVYTTISPSLYDTKVQQLSLSGDAALRLEFDKLSCQLKLSYNERDEQFLVINKDRIPQNFIKDKEELEASKDNHSSLFKMNASLYYDITVKNRIEFTGSASLYRYDTPAESNYDDRDELDFIVYIAHRYNNLTNLQITTSADLNLYHTVYIFPQKSANNNWNRVLRLTSRSIFEPSERFRTVNTISVTANYTVYDFEDLVSTVKSYSFRQFNVKDSTRIMIWGDLGIDLCGEIKLYDRGELNWKAFSMKPLNYFEDRYINVSLIFINENNFLFSGGYKYFEQRKFNYLNGEKIFDTFVRTQGPFTRLRFYLKDSSFLELVSSYDYYRYSNSSQNSSNGNIYINALFNF